MEGKHFKPRLEFQISKGLKKIFPASAGPAFPPVILWEGIPKEVGGFPAPPGPV